MILWIGYGTETGSFSQIKISPWIRTRFLWENLCRHLSAEILNTNCSKVSENRVNECYSYTSTHTMLSSTHGPQPHQQYSDRFAPTFTHIYLCGVLNRSIQPTGLAHWEISLGLVHAFKYLYVFMSHSYAEYTLFKGIPTTTTIKPKHRTKQNKEEQHIHMECLNQRQLHSKQTNLVMTSCVVLLRHE